MRRSRGLDWSPILWCRRFLVCDLQPCDDCRHVVTRTLYTMVVLLRERETDRDVEPLTRVYLDTDTTNRTTTQLNYDETNFPTTSKGGSPPGSARRTHWQMPSAIHNPRLYHNLHPMWIIDAAIRIRLYWFVFIWITRELWIIAGEKVDLLRVVKLYSKSATVPVFEYAARFTRYDELA